MIKYCLLFLSIFISQSNIQAQTWQWAKNGGGTNSTSLSGDNKILDIKNDKVGNVFILGLVTRSIAYSMGDTFVINGQNDLLLYKLDCDGNKIWQKQIGDMGSDDGDYNPTLQLDKDNNVYIIGYSDAASTHGFRIDTDSFFLPAIGKYYRSYIVKFDMNGIFLLYKTNETFRATNGIIYLNSYIGNDNNLNVLALMGGNVLGISDTIVPKYYILKYDTNIVLQSYFPLTDSGGIDDWSITGDDEGHLYLSGYTTSAGSDTRITIKGGHQVPEAKCFITKFDTSGTFSWITMNEDSGTGFHDIRFNRDLNFIEATGEGGAHSSFGGTKFDTLILSNPFNSQGSSIIMLFDTSGRAVRGNIIGATCFNVANTIDHSNTNSIIIGGIACGHTNFGAFDFPSSIGQDGFYATLNSNLEFTGGAVLEGTGFYDAVTKVSHDERGNIYIGGYMEGNLNLPGDTLYKIGGGASDLFIAKYGVATCSCPYTIANYNDAYTSSLTYTYTSSAINADSIWWNFGDGATQSGGTTATHTYSVAGNYTVCQHTSNVCSLDEFCKNIDVVLSIKEVKENYSVVIYPNPASTSVHIHVQGDELPRNSVYLIFDVNGKQILSGRMNDNDTTIMLPSSMSDGVYLMEVNDGEGRMLLSKRVVMIK